MCILESISPKILSPNPNDDDTTTTTTTIPTTTTTITLTLMTMTPPPLAMGAPLPLFPTHCRTFFTQTVPIIPIIAANIKSLDNFGPKTLKIGYFGLRNSPKVLIFLPYLKYTRSNKAYTVSPKYNYDSGKKYKIWAILGQKP